MSSHPLLRWSAWILLIGAMLDFIDSILLNVIPGPEGLNGPPAFVPALGGILTTLLLLLGLPAFYTALSKQARVLSLVGVIAAAVAFLALIALYSRTLLVSNSVTGHDNGPSPITLTLFLITDGAGLIGLLCVGIAVLRTTVFPKLIGVFFLVALLSLAGFFLAGVPIWLSLIISLLGAVGLDGAWFFSGLTLVRREAVAQGAASESTAS